MEISVSCPHPDCEGSITFEISADYNDSSFTMMNGRKGQRKTCSGKGKHSAYAHVITVLVEKK